MVAYFHGNSSEIGGGDGLQTLILMNPSYAAYSDGNLPATPQQGGGSFVSLNPNSAANGLQEMSQAPSSHAQHLLVGIPLQAGAISAAYTTSASVHQQHDVSAFHGFLQPRVNYNFYNSPVDLPMAAGEVARTPQGLSLSLSSQQPTIGYGLQPQPQPQSQPSSSRAIDAVRVSLGPPSQASIARNGVAGVHSVLLSSKYLKATQELLDEVVNIGKDTGDATSPAALSGEGQCVRDIIVKPTAAAELTTAERQETQMKKAKLVNMLDEVEQRYRQYQHQMQAVVSWFDQAAGKSVSATTYIAVALRTVSKQFRCLRDAILGQIEAASQGLGEEENIGGRMEGSGLKYEDDRIRRRWALQRLGVVPHGGWRPQRGLPERSVSVLRAWLFEHFLHPYPKDSDKMMLAKETGLTRSQVSNWFINARVRLWKPMVEEMYMEEMKVHETEPTSKTQTSEIPNDGLDLGPSKNNCPSVSPISSPVDPTSIPRHFSRGFDVTGPPSSTSETRAGFGLIGGPSNLVGGLGAYPMDQVGRFGAEPYPGNRISLSLALHHPTLLHPGSLGPEIEGTIDFVEMGGPTTNLYESMSIQNEKGFAARLLPDFVA